ncbi:MAG: TrkH family potassium uptake protein [Lachnospiraceae bacterium]|nr:TrkH family potassium uptake protein [Lachnospiraceae bacterium]
MNRSIVRYILCKVLEFEALFLLIPCFFAIYYQEVEGIVYFVLACVALLIGCMGTLNKPKSDVFYAREGFVTVALSWILLGIFGAIPFCLTGEIPNFVDALFETISGFTTTGATILTDVEVISHCSLFWRSFTHWIGGMGVLVFILAFTPMAGGYNIHLMRAESPGPSVGKLVPKIKQTSKILYAIYTALTVIEMILLIISGMPVFDSITLSMGTAGTGGFGVLNSSIGSYSMVSQGIITVFMILFGVNFTVYYLLLLKKFKPALLCEEVRWYLIIILSSAALITINIKGYYKTIFECFHHAIFQVASVITTTGYSTADFDTWPTFSKTIMVTIMFCGACAGSTGGGLKVSRIMIYVRHVKNELNYALHPNQVKKLELEGKALDTSTIRSTMSYLSAFLLLFVVSTLIVSLDGFDPATTFTAIVATINNIGPGLGKVGPTGNFSEFSILSKLVMTMDMLIGRLEVFPILILFNPNTWRKGK